MKNNKPLYVLIEYSQLEKVEKVEDMEVSKVARRILSKHMRAFEELALCGRVGCRYNKVPK